MRGQGMVVTEAGALFRKRIHSGMSHLQAAVAKCMGSAAPENPHLYRQISESQLACFHATFETGSFKMAAVTLDLTLSTIHRNFRSLEALLGTKLAETSPNSARRNSAGDAFFTL